MKKVENCWLRVMCVSWRWGNGNWLTQPENSLKGRRPAEAAWGSKGRAVVREVTAPMMGRKSCRLSRSSTHVLDILFTNIPPDSAFHLPTCKPGSPVCIDQASSLGWPLGEPAGDQTLHFYPSLKSLNSFPKRTSSHLFKLSEKYFLNLPSLEMLLQTMSSQSY